MILKKPYAFLIKHFRLIHLIITFLLVVIVFKTSSILNFLNLLAKEEVSKYNAINYISYLPVFLSIIAIFSMLAIYLLMRYKNKPKRVYLISIIGYFIYIIILFITYLYFESIQDEIVTLKILRIYRDIFIMQLIFQYIIIAIMFIRGIGFNIKKFNFAKDLQELNIDISDDEEVELNVGLDTTKVVRGARKKKREFIYYVKENKLFVILFVSVLVAITGIYYLLNTNLFNKVYEEGEKVKTSNYIFKIKDSYVTTTEYNNNSLGDEYSYVIVKFAITSRGEETDLDISNFILHIGKNDYQPTKALYSSFTDIGEGYDNQSVTDEENEYILVYKIDHKYHKSSKKLSYEYSTSKYSEIKNIKLEDINLDKVSSTKNYKVGNTIKFKNSILGNSTFKITKYEYGDSFDYTTNYCTKTDKCVELKKSIKKNDDDSITLLKLDVESFYDESITMDNISLINFYGTINYSTSGKIFVSKLNNRTPNSVNEYIFLEVDKNVTLADKVWLELKIKNKKYKYVIG